MVESGTIRSTAVMATTRCRAAWAQTGSLAAMAEIFCSVATTRIISAADYLDGDAGSDAYIFGAGFGGDVIGSFDESDSLDQDLIYFPSRCCSSPRCGRV